VGKIDKNFLSKACDFEDGNSPRALSPTSRPTS